MTGLAIAGVLDAARDPLRRRQRLVLAALSVLLALAVLAACAIGALAIAPDHVLAAVAARLGIDTGVVLEPYDDAVLFDIRLPRIALGLGVGAMLGISGAALQALFRNPLADPGLAGVSGGAAFGAVGWIVLGAAAPAVLQGPFALPVAAFAGGLAATAGVLVIGRGRGAGDTATLLLAGLAVNALCTAAIGYLTYLGTDVQLRALTFWLLGGLGGASWAQVWPALIACAVALAGLVSLARRFDALALGERTAGHLGLDVALLRRLTVLLVALGVGAGVALTGMIGFVGLAAPHLARLAGGPAHRYVLPAAGLTGALLLVVTDLVARIAVAPAELPVGVVTSAIGAPFFIWLLRRRQKASAP